MMSHDKLIKKIKKLQGKLRETRENMPEQSAIRLHRAISWLRAASSYSISDEDISFITLWISFNSCYALQNKDSFERQSFCDFTSKIVKLDQNNEIYQSIWSKYSSFIRSLINNQYVYQPFWKSQQDLSEDWVTKFNQSKRVANRALANSDVATLLSIILDRLYVLRNQLIHGGATHNSSLNRFQVTDGKSIMLILMPIFIELMMECDEDWGKVAYPATSEYDLWSK